MLKYVECLHFQIFLQVVLKSSVAKLKKCLKNHAVCD